VLDSFLNPSYLKGKGMSISIANNYSPVGGLTASQPISASAFLANTAQKLVAAPVSLDAEVNISPIAQQINETGLSGWVNERIEWLRNDPDQKSAMQWVEGLMTHTETCPPPYLYDPDSDGIHGLFYFNSGEPVTPENKLRYIELGRIKSAETTRIFNAEKAKGTPAAEIFEKAQRYVATLPDDYLSAIGWFRETYAVDCYSGATPHPELARGGFSWNQALRQAQPERPDVIQDLFKILDNKS
jgi:hypothetical protein